MSIANPGTFVSAIRRSDHALMHRVHHWSAPEWLQFLMTGASRCGDGWLWYALGFALLAAGGEDRYLAVGAAMSAAFVGMSLYTIVKKATKRKRPCLVEPHTWAHMLPPDQYSFPSGHTLAAFSIAVAVGGFYPSLVILLLSCATLIALSRIMLGMHFLSDVIAGAVLGTFIGREAYVFFLRAAAS